VTEVTTSEKVGLAPSTSSPIEATSETGLDLSVIIPVFNELETLEPLYDLLKQSLTPWESRCEILFINDGSSDGSSEKLQQLAALDRRVRVLEFVRNFGQTAAIAAGFDYARGKIIIPLDADLQNDPQDIPRIMEKLDQGYDVVNCWRQDRKDPWLSRKLPSQLANRLISWISGVYLRDYGCTLKGYRRDIVRHIRLYGEMHRFIPIFASWAGARVTEIPVRHHARRFGESKYGMTRTVKVLLDLITIKFLGSYSTKPMYLFGSLGLLSFLGGSLLSAVTLYQKFFEAVKAHRNPLLLLSIFLFTAGLQFILFGLVAELIMRTYHESQDKPIYLLKKRETESRKQQTAKS
jgi:glycosyltransferase involved in cell wall biosynthesis